MINSFTGENRWLSNFWPCVVMLPPDEFYTSVENAYQAAKSPLRAERELIACLTAARGVLGVKHG